MAGASAGIGEGHHEPVRAAVDRLPDQRLHAREGVDVGRAVVDEHVELLGGGVDAVADDGPERARRLPVGHHGDADGVARALARRRAPAPGAAPPATTTGASRRTVVPPQPVASTVSDEQRGGDGAPHASASSGGAGAGVALGRRGMRASSRVPLAGRAVDAQRAVDRGEPVLQAAQPAARVDVDAAAAVVGHDHDHLVALAPDLDARAGGRPRSGRRWSAPRPPRSTRRPRSAAAAAPPPPWRSPARS